MAALSVKNKINIARQNDRTIISRATVGSLAGNALIGLSFHYFNILQGPWKGLALGMLSFGGSICMGSFRALESTVAPKANFRAVTNKAVGVLCLGLAGIVLGVYHKNLPLKVAGTLLSVASNVYANIRARQIIRLSPQAPVQK